MESVIEQPFRFDFFFLKVSVILKQFLPTSHLLYIMEELNSSVYDSILIGTDTTTSILAAY
jgi:hypothetical protein